jgi:hypothetical protein
MGNECLFFPGPRELNILNIEINRSMWYTVDQA